MLGTGRSEEVGEEEGGGSEEFEGEEAAEGCSCGEEEGVGGSCGELALSLQRLGSEDLLAEGRERIDLSVPKVNSICAPCDYQQPGGFLRCTL